MPKLCVEYSKSGRAKCSNTSCGKKIEKHELRIGTEVIMPFSDDGVESWKWRHLCCFTERQLSNAKGTGDIDAIQGEEELAAADKALVQRMREGKLVGNTSIIGRVGDVAHSPLASELSGKGGKAAKAKASAPATGSTGAPATPAASAGQKRPRAPSRKTAKASATVDDDDGVDSEATEEYEVVVETVSGLPRCPYGANCFRVNEEHFRQYRHEEKEAALPSSHGGGGGGPTLKPVIKRRKV
ncbi:Poly(ADP-ribose) polymerase-like protein [Novymonas esmeraldas]|uniref:Poly(ADP-ribose) polymerase-like protein n=1 Tax=Novymonas esmeraldas TaxID=1808958 RepID=A0AAW0EZM1_9TRYP